MLTRLVLMSVIVFASALTSDAQPANEAAPEVTAAIDGVLALFQQKPVVVLCDYHGLAQEEVFYSALIRDVRFAESVGNVVVEFGGEAWQATIDRYVGGEDVPLNELRRVWTETPGWVPGATRLGYINFFANVRAANLRLPPDRRIKVWLGEPKIDWSKINSFQDLQPYVAQRDDNYVRIIGDEILKKHKKTLLIIGTGHIFAAAPLANKFDKVYSNRLATVVPFTGYVEPACNTKFVERARNWPIPATIKPVSGTSLKPLMRLPGCNFYSAETIAHIRAIPVKKLPPGVSSAEEMLDRDISMASGDAADAVLYLGPPETLTESPVDPSIYLDSEYFKEQDRRLQCCTTLEYKGKLDWDRILQQNSVVPRKLKTVS